MRARIGDELRTLPRQFWLLTAGTFVYLIGVEMCYPFESLFLNQTLGVPMTRIGVIIGVTLLATLPLQVVGGALADRFGRRPLLVIAICASMTLYIGLGLARQLWLVVALMAFEAAFGWAQYITASNAMIADLTPEPRRAEAFSITRVALNAGMVFGPLLAGPLMGPGATPDFRTTFIVAGLICGVFLLMVLFLFKETRPAAARTTSVAASFSGYGTVLRDRRLFLFCLVALLPMYAFGQVWVTFPVVLRDLLGQSAQSWSILVAVYALSTAVLQYPVVRLLGKKDHMLLMALSSACIGLGLGGSAFLPWPATYVTFFLLSFGVVLLIPIGATVVSELAPAHLRGRYMGVWTLFYMGGYALGPMIGGWTLDTLGGRRAYAVVAASGLLGAALFPLLRRGQAPSGEPAAEADDAAGGEPFDGRLVGERPEQVL